MSIPRWITPLERQIAEANAHPILQVAMYLTIAILLGLAAFLIGKLFFGHHQASGIELITETLHSKIFWSDVGRLLAQIVDGALAWHMALRPACFVGVRRVTWCSLRWRDVALAGCSPPACRRFPCEIGQ